MARGDMVASLAITEPGAGSDVGHPQHGGPRRRRLSAQRPERPSSPTAFTPTACWWRPRPIRRPSARHQLCSGGRGHAGFTRGWLLDRSASAPRTPPSCSSRTCWCPTRTCWASRAGLWLHDEGAGARTADDRRARHGAGKRAAMDGGTRQAAPGVRQGAARQPVHPLQAGRYQDAGRHPRIRRRLRASTWTASWTRPARPWLLWAAEATRAIDDLLQFHGGYGYMREYRSAGRTRTSGRTASTGRLEIMRELIARTL